MARILVVDDEKDMRQAVAEVLRYGGHDVLEAGSAAEAAPLLRNGGIAVLISDLRMPGASGLDLLREAASRNPDCVLLVMTAYGSMQDAIEALRLGAHDFLVKPVSLEALARKVDLFVRHQAALAENRLLRGQVEREAPPSGLVGTSPAIEDVRRLITRFAPGDATVLIVGETGTGKELVARAIHGASPRADRPFVAVNCGSIAEGLIESELFGHVKGAFTGADRDKRGLFEVAGEGSILLDEIGEMSPSLQPKVLRALEAREAMRVGATSTYRISARVIASTHRDLAAMVAEGRFRQDLYYRLNVLTVRVPPLRDRPQDVLPLAQHLLERICARTGRPLPAIESDAVAALEGYRWPGNVRELANVLERAVVLADGPRIRLVDLSGIESPATDVGDDLRAARDAFERAHIKRVLARHGGDKRRAAAALGIDLSSLYRKIEEP